MKFLVASTILETLYTLLPCLLMVSLTHGDNLVIYRIVKWYCIFVMTKVLDPLKIQLQGNQNVCLVQSIAILNLLSWFPSTAANQKTDLFLSSCLSCN